MNINKFHLNIEVPGDFQEIHGYGTKGHGLVGMAGMFDCMIVVVFSNLVSSNLYIQMTQRF